jgi:stage V sporulation protein B
MISAVAAGKAEQRGKIAARDLLTFQGYLLAFSAAMNLLQKVDLILIKALSSADPTIASENAGYYAAAINLANLTYQIVISVTFVVFPLISQATFTKDRSAAQLYISNTMRYSLMIMALVATLFSANAGEALRVVFPAQFQAAAPALSVVAYGMLFFGLLYVLTTMISASGRPGVSLTIGLLTLAASAALNAWLIPRYGLAGAALATTGAMAAGSVAGAYFVAHQFGALVSGVSVVRIALCAAAIYVVSWVFPAPSRLFIIFKLACLSLSFVGLLVVARELKGEEWRTFLRIAGRVS